MVQKLDYLKETPSQTAGPYVHIGLAPGDAGFDIYRQELGRDIAGPEATGERIKIQGQVLDGTGAPVKDVLIEVWQANAAGIYPGIGDVETGFRGWGRVIPDFETGEWSFATVKPAPVPGRGPGLMAPHINFWLVARGINVGLNTRLYFSDETAANETDPILNLIEQADRRDTLVARRDGSVYRFDIRLQGDKETVFFDV
ncbi:protocatechuate 3,4-dioxygenase subunit alpha [Ruegeria sp. EL01]|jgi:protocatechuate 3,4-dioxygenase alpha subunit|uniref:protocatechuate 3,4-dioxygenase subunit alpha n=1 Tax=Ruegeria sp. EL01 TaxID=2107578 RepID=UPI000EA81B96|nr:protocatechuate 3,4-dioxygenase subunit alpha [Ruegeria sp. EL01]